MKNLSFCILLVFLLAFVAEKLINEWTKLKQ